MALTDAEIERITDAVRREIGEKADPEAIIRAVRQLSADPLADNGGGEETAAPSTRGPNPTTLSPTRLAAEIPADFERSESDGNRIIVAAFGRNRPGVASALTGVLAECKCDIADITQKILQEFFSMIMIVDMTNAGVDFATLRTRLQEIESRLGITVMAQHQDVFRSMHRI